MTKSVHRFLERLEVRRDNEGGNSGADVYLANHDLLPIPKQNRIWDKWTYSLFWFGECASVTSWTVASTGVKAGLSWWEAWYVLAQVTETKSPVLTCLGSASSWDILSLPPS